MLSLEGPITVPFANDYTFGELVSIHRTQHPVRGISQRELVHRINNIDDLDDLSELEEEKLELQAELTETTDPKQIEKYRALIRNVGKKIDRELIGIRWVEDQGYVVNSIVSEKMSRVLRLSSDQKQVFNANRRRDYFQGSPLLTELSADYLAFYLKEKNKPKQATCLLDPLLLMFSEEKGLSSLEGVRFMGNLISRSLAHVYFIKSGEYTLEPQEAEILIKYVKDNPSFLPYLEWSDRLAAAVR